MSLIKGDETIYTGNRNLFWMYGHSRAELIYIPLVSGQKRDGNIIQSHSKFKIIADTYQMATLSLFEDYSVDSFTKSFLANKLKVDYNKLDNLVLSHLEKLKIIKIQAWIHHTQGSTEVYFRSNNLKVDENWNLALDHEK